MRDDLPTNYATLDEMHRLVTSVLGGNASPEQEHCLRDLIRQDIEVCDLYLNVVFDSSMLFDWAKCDGTAEADATDPSPAPTFSLLLSPIHRAFGHSFLDASLAYLLAAIVVGVGLAIMAIIPASRPSEIVKGFQSGAGQQHTISEEERVVGRITGMVDCVWEGSGFRGQGSESDDRKSEIRNQKSPVAVGDRLALRSGLLEITYDTGARVILQGPVSYEVNSAAGGHLSVGKLTARLEKKAEGPADQKSEVPNHQSSAFFVPPSPFVVTTPTAIITDLGTEFGVEVNDAGRTTSHVFQGSIRLKAIGVKDAGPARILRASQSACVAKAGENARPVIETVAVHQGSFVRVEQLSKLIRLHDSKAFQRWLAYSQELRRDPSLVAYYDFQKEPDSHDVLRNVAVNGDRSLDGAIENAVWSTGRMSGKDALRFAVRDTYVRIHLPQKMEDFTLAAWINIHSLDNPYSGLLMSDAWENSAGRIHWQLQNNGRIILAINGHTDDFHPYQSNPAFDRALFDRWIHVAAVHNHATASVQFYRNGQPVGEGTIPGHIPVCIGPAKIGFWRMEGEDRNFRGRIDEMAIFRRSLRSDEIRRMFEAGRPGDVYDSSNKSRTDVREEKDY